MVAVSTRFDSNKEDMLRDETGRLWPEVNTERKQGTCSSESLVARRPVTKEVGTAW